MKEGAMTGVPGSGITALGSTGILRGTEIELPESSEMESRVACVCHRSTALGPGLTGIVHMVVGHRSVCRASQIRRGLVGRVLLLKLTSCASCTQHRHVVWLSSWRQH